MNPPRTARIGLMVIGVAIWGAALLGTLQLHHFAGFLGHSICGPWGCAAAPEALVGYHAFWLVILAPAAVLACRAMPWSVRRAFAALLVALGVGGAAAIAGHAAIEWRQDARNEVERGYALQRAGFVLATSPDMPVAPIAMAGLACFAFGGAAATPPRTRPGRRSQSGEDAEGTPETP